MKKRLTKLAALLIGAACMLFIFGCSASDETAQEKSDTSSAEETVETITVARPGLDIKIAAIIVASEMGYYKEEGVNVEFEQVADLATGLTAVSTEEIDVLPFGVIPSCSFVSQGTDVVVFGGTISEGSEALTTPENAEAYLTADDYVGAKIGCFRMETGHMVFKGWLRENGVDVENDVEWVYLDSSASISEAVAKGEVDVGFVNSGYGYVATQSGNVVVAYQVGDYVENFPCCRMTTNRTAITEKSDALTKFMIANLRAYELLQTDKETSINCLVNYSGQDAAYVENVIYGTEDYDAAMTISLDPCKTAVEAFYETMKANGNIDANTTFDMADHIDTTIYKAALETMLEREPDNTLWTDLAVEFEANNTK